MITLHYNDLLEQVGLETKSISWDDTEYISGTRNVQINDKIVLTIKSDFSFFSSWVENGIDVELVSVMTGRSGVYYK